jgi:hypothetical protein
MSGRAPVGGEPPNPMTPPFRDNVACHLAHDDPNWLARG